MKKMKIFVIEICNRNLGDTVIAECTKYLIRKAIPWYRRHRYEIINYNSLSEDYDYIRQADAIVFAGGGLIKFRQENFWNYTSRIIETAHECGIPVYMNATGVEGYDEADERCQTLKHALNLPNVRYITTRDDIDTLEQHYVENPAIITRKISDSAFFSKDVYGIHKDPSSNRIGIGVIRSRIFDDYGNKLSKEEQLHAYGGLIELLESNGYEVRLFTNGMYKDYAFALEILERYGRDPADYIDERYAKTEQLVRMIASCKAIFACRMHANIVAFSLGVPSISVAWNNKLRFFGRYIGHPERVLDVPNFKAELIYPLLQEAIKEGCDDSSIDYTSSVTLLRAFLGSVRPLSHPQVRVDFSRLFATGMGGDALHYRNINSPDIYKDMYQQGFRCFETDVRMTSDQELVCVDGWNEKSYRKMRVPTEEYDSHGMAAEDFLHCKVFDYYHTATFDSIYHTVFSRGDTRLILDVGRPARKDFPLMLKKLKTMIADRHKRRIMIRVQNAWYVDQVKKSGLDVEIIYYLSPEQAKNPDDLKSTADYMSGKDISILSINEKSASKENLAYFHQKKIRTMIFSVNTVSDFLRLYEYGADYIGTNHLNIRELTRVYR